MQAGNGVNLRWPPAKQAKGGIMPKNRQYLVTAAVQQSVVLVASGVVCLCRSDAPVAQVDRATAF